MIRPFWGVYESVGTKVYSRGTYADRESACDARSLMVDRNIDDGSKRFYVLQWLPVYGINTMIGPDGNEIVQDFFKWIHTDEHKDRGNERWSFCDNMLLAITNSIDQWFAMQLVQKANVS